MQVSPNVLISLLVMQRASAADTLHPTRVLHLLRVGSVHAITNCTSCEMNMLHDCTINDHHRNLASIWAARHGVSHLPVAQQTGSWAALQTRVAP